MPGVTSTSGSRNRINSPCAVRLPMLRARVLPKFRGMRKTVTFENSASIWPQPSRLPASTTRTSIRSRCLDALSARRHLRRASMQFQETITTETLGSAGVSGEGLDWGCTATDHISPNIHNGRAVSGPGGTGHPRPGWPVRRVPAGTSGIRGPAARVGSPGRSRRTDGSAGSRFRARAGRRIRL